MTHYLVLDVGGTFIKYALLDQEAHILERGRTETPKASLDAFLKALDPVVDTYRDRIAGIAVSIPGMLDSAKGYCVTAGALGYFCDTPMAEILSSRYGLPVSLENDGKCAALAEKWRGSLKDCQNGAVVILGTGVGGGLILNGSLYRGTHYTAGEYSYIITDDSRPKDINTFWGFKSGAEMLAKMVAAHTKEDWKSYNGEKIFALANSGEPTALAGLKDFTDSLAIQIYNLNICLDLERIAIGGGISRQPLLFEYIEKSMDDFLCGHPIKALNPYVPRPEITHCTFYNDANLVGALCHYFELM